MVKRQTRVFTVVCALCTIIGVAMGSTSVSAVAVSPPAAPQTIVSSLSAPAGLATDKAGNLYVVNNSADTVSVLPASSGVLFGIPVTAGLVTTLIPRFNTSGLELTSLDHPVGIALDASGNIYVASEYSNGGTSDAGTVSVFARASGDIFGEQVTADTLTPLVTSGLVDPTGLAFDTAGNLYIADLGNERVAVLPQSSGSLFGTAVTANTVSTVVTAAQFGVYGSGSNGPSALAFDASGNLYMASEFANSVGVLPRASGILFGKSVTADSVSVLIGRGGGLDLPDGVSVDSGGNLFIADAGGWVSVLSASSGTIFGHQVTADQSTVLDSNVSSLTGVTVDGAGNVYVSNSYYGSVVVLPVNSGLLFDQPVTADIPDAIAISVNPSGIAVDGAGNVYVANEAGNSIIVLPRVSGTLFGVPVVAGVWNTLVADTNSPADLAFDSAGNLYVVGGIPDGTISVLSPSSGTFFGQSMAADTLTAVASGLRYPRSIALDAAGDVFVTGGLGSSSSNSSVSVLAVSSGTLFGQSVTADALTVLFTSGDEVPPGLAVDGAGNIYVSVNQDAVAVYPRASGTLFGQPVTADTLTTLLPNLDDPTALRFDNAGNLFVATAVGGPGNVGTVDVIVPVTTTVFGQYVNANSMHILASSGIDGPASLAFDPSGDLFIGDGIGSVSEWYQASPDTTPPPSPISTKVRLVRSKSPVANGHRVTFTATVRTLAGSTAVSSGTVTFIDGASILGTTIVSDAGKASWVVRSLSAGTHSISAVYNGATSADGATYAPSQSRTLTERVSSRGTG
jgi:sugar lactone lactonase YvrE